MVLSIMSKILCMMFYFNVIKFSKKCIFNKPFIKRIMLEFFKIFLKKKIKFKNSISKFILINHLKNLFRYDRFAAATESCATKN